MRIGVLVLLAVAQAPSGRAPLRLQLDKCADLELATVSRVVTMELEATLADDRRTDAVTTASAECAEARVRLTIDDPVTGKSTTRTLDLDGQPRNLRSRLLGLAIAEAVLASWIELRLPREAAAPPAGTGASPETRREAADIAERRLRVAAARPAAAREIVAGPALRWFSSGLLTFGLSASARHWLDRQPHAGVGLEIDGSHGERSLAKVASANATSFSLAPCLLMRSDFDEVLVTASAGFRAGLARLSADPVSSLRSGRAAWRGWTGPFLAVDLSVPLGRALLLRASAESGYALVPARGGVDSVDVVALSGAWLGAVLSLGMKL